MAGSVDKHMIETIRSQVLADPLLPRPNPTEAFWQLPAHAKLSETQSPTLPEKADIVVIGSGITGCSIARNLLENPASESKSVIVFEARSLTSGATGRNGGALTSFAPYDFSTLLERFGAEQAIKIGRFANRTLNKMHEIGNSSAAFKDASEVRRLRDVVAFFDEASFEGAKVSFEAYEEHMPEGEDQGTIEILTAEDLRSRFNVKGAIGAVVFDCGAFWPYRLITRIWEGLLDDHKNRLTIETRTPVTAVSHSSDAPDGYPYVVSTPRGSVRAQKVIHATNGYAGHLLPTLRGKIFPLRGTMSTQKATSQFGQYGTERAWSFCHSGKYDKDTGEFETGLYYSNQNPKTGDIFIGGEKVKLDEIIVSDDSKVSAVSRENISTVLPKFFEKGWQPGERPEVRKVWSGIMGFTGDHLPLVGCLPQSVTGRGDQEYICAAFNGYGMPQCWSSGEAVAMIALGEPKPEWLPEVYLPSEQRLNDGDRLSPEAGLRWLLRG